MNLKKFQHNKISNTFIFNFLTIPFMAKHIFYCSKCQEYTMKQQCLKCSQKTAERKPAKFSPEDKYGQYRREVKAGQRKIEGLI